MRGEPRTIDTTEATLYALTPGSLPPGYSTDATYYATWQAVEEALAGASENMCARTLNNHDNQLGENRAYALTALLSPPRSPCSNAQFSIVASHLSS